VEISSGALFTGLNVTPHPDVKIETATANENNAVVRQ
jgi:hypothetical protein